MKKLLIGFFSIFFLSTPVMAELLIAPLLIELGPRDRSAQVSVINSGEATTTYKISFEEKKQLDVTDLPKGKMA